MTRARQLSALIGATLVATCLGVLTPSSSPPAAAVEVVQDGGLEAATGNPLDSPSWSETQSDDTRPLLCSLGTCDTQSGLFVPHTGTNFAAFDVLTTDAYAASLSQVVTIPDGAATLRYWIRTSRIRGPAEAELAVSIDGHVVRTHHEGSDTDPGYAQMSVDLAEYADGGSHTLSFDFTDPAGTGFDTMLLDDVSIQAAPLPAGFAAEPGSLGDIPDPDVCGTPAAPRDVTFAVAGIPGGVTDVAVRFKLAPEHTWGGDLVAELVAPGGAATAVVFARIGLRGPTDDGYPAHLGGPYLFSDSAPAAPSWWTIAEQYGFEGTIPAGSYRASAPGTGANTSLTAPFAGLAHVNGTWTLRFQDYCIGSAGAVASAKLLLTPAAVVPDTTAPDTVITSAPAKGVAKSLTVPFGFAASEPGATFSCALDGAAYAACSSPLTLHVTPGAHTLRVSAADAAGNLDATPATASFQAFDCKTLDATVTKLAHKTKVLKKNVKATKAKLAKAKADGDKAKAKQLQAKLTKQQKQLKKATKQHQLAVAAAAPCHSGDLT